MPLALMGFSLQSVPLENSTVLSSSLVPRTRLVLSINFRLQPPACLRAKAVRHPEGRCESTNTPPAWY
jgi:hypothetical protein